MNGVPNWSYRSCGLSIRSNAPLPALRATASTHAADLVVVLHGHAQGPRVSDTTPTWYQSPSRDERNRPALTIWTRGSAYLFSYAEGARFLVDAGGSRVEAWWDPPLTDSDAADYLLGGVLAFVSRLRGRVPLHASAVVIDGRAILFAGSAWAGKSSMATAFAGLGFPVLSDDVVAVADEEGGLIAYPSRLRLSLWSDSASALCASKTLPVHSATYPKHRLDLDDVGYSFHDAPVAIEQIFVLGERSSTHGRAIRTLTPPAAVIALATHTYGNGLLDAALRAREFDVLARLAGRVRVSELSMREGLDDLVANCRLLVAENDWCRRDLRNGVGSHFLAPPQKMTPDPISQIVK